MGTWFGLVTVEETTKSETLLMKEAIQRMLDERPRTINAVRSPSGDSILVFDSPAAAQGFVDGTPGWTIE